MSLRSEKWVYAVSTARSSLWLEDDILSSKLIATFFSEARRLPVSLDYSLRFFFLVARLLSACCLILVVDFCISQFLFIYYFLFYLNKFCAISTNLYFSHQVQSSSFCTFKTWEAVEFKILRRTLVSLNTDKKVFSAGAASIAILFIRLQFFYFCAKKFH